MRDFVQTGLPRRRMLGKLVLLSRLVLLGRLMLLGRLVLLPDRLSPHFERVLMLCHLGVGLISRALRLAVHLLKRQRPLLAPARPKGDPEAAEDGGGGGDHDPSNLPRR